MNTLTTPHLEIAMRRRREREEAEARRRRASHTPHTVAVTQDSTYDYGYSSDSSGYDSCSPSYDSSSSDSW